MTPLLFPLLGFLCKDKVNFGGSMLVWGSSTFLLFENILVFLYAVDSLFLTCFENELII
jgi:hypothetical protein